ncbi:RidA family protein [Prosthecodimorpha staleyi]|uniref:RidA family protein n=1 Tax=Prosthecodimorpha staleyi TaxID=2840188 RepID=A0A947D5S7_9HYPH|nr:RidA family protein [Prosthecodimorpha staleyi]MBT9291583.1 RidA family protein [Prosthecodimorpha staleyi]
MPKTTLVPASLSFQPRPSYPYSPGTAAAGFVFTAGQVAWTSTGELVGLGDVPAQTRQVLTNIRAILAEAGATMDDVLKCNVYLADIRHFAAMNAVFAEFFPKDPPARTTVQAALAEPEMLVEIEAIAYVKP